MSVKVKLAPMPGVPATPPMDDDALQQTFNDRLTIVFNALDRDGNGVVTVAELNSWVPTGSNGGAQINKRDLVHACQNSENGELDYFQFLQACKATRIGFNAPAGLPSAVASAVAMSRLQKSRLPSACVAALPPVAGSGGTARKYMERAKQAKARAKGGFKQVAGLTKNEEFEAPTRRGLIKIETKRKELLERSKYGRLIVLFSWTGTILRWSTASVQLWSAMVVFVLTRIYMRTVDMDPKSLPMLSMGQVSIISGFLFFFLIFYVSHCYARFDQQVCFMGALARSNHSL